MTPAKIDDLFDAVRRDDSTRLRFLLDQSHDWRDARDTDGNSLLLTALYHGRSALAAELIARGAPVNLWEAAALGDLPRLTSHLDAQPADVHAHSHDGWTPLHLAAHFGQAAAVGLLLERGADVHARSTNPLNNVPLHAALAGRQAEAARLLLDAGADPNAVEHGGYTSLHQAAQNGDASLVALLLERGARTDSKDDQGRTPLDLAEAGQHAQAAGLLRPAAQA